MAPVRHPDPDMDFTTVGLTRRHRPGSYLRDRSERSERRRVEIMPSGNPYLKALASPGALRFSAAGILGRMPISMFGLGTVLQLARRLRTVT